MITMTCSQPRQLPPTALVWHDAPRTLETVAAEFEPICLKQMDAVALLNRTDTKFIMPAGQLLDVLAQLVPAYRMLTINGQRLNHYRTLYFDTPDFALYTAHVNGRAERYKVRSREYTDTHLSFLEVKRKTRQDRTIKERLSTAQPTMQMTVETANWLRRVSPLDGGTLEPKLWNTFTRMTLVSKQHTCTCVWRKCCERVTLDIDLTFYATDRVARLDGLSIAEVKMDSSCPASPFLVQMRDQRIRPHGFSKYAMGVALLYDHVKKNALKPDLLWIDKMTKGAGGR
jgi:hypothetical protein